MFPLPKFQLKEVPPVPKSEKLIVKGAIPDNASATILAVGFGLVVTVNTTTVVGILHPSETIAV